MSAGIWCGGSLVPNRTTQSLPPTKIPCFLFFFFLHHPFISPTWVQTAFSHVFNSSTNSAFHHHGLDPDA